MDGQGHVAYGQSADTRRSHEGTAFSGTGLILESEVVIAVPLSQVSAASALKMPFRLLLSSFGC